MAGQPAHLLSQGIGMHSAEQTPPCLQPDHGMPQPTDGSGLRDRTSNDQLVHLSGTPFLPC